jgi:hypothetical protein
MKPPAATRLLSEALVECRRGAALLARLLDEAALLAPASPDREAIADGIERLALRARLLSLDARLEGLRRPEVGRGFNEAAREIAAFADRCEEVAALVLGAGARAPRLGARLALRASLLVPRSMRPSTS